MHICWTYHTLHFVSISFTSISKMQLFWQQWQGRRRTGKWILVEQCSICIGSPYFSNLLCSQPPNLPACFIIYYLISLIYYLMDPRAEQYLHRLTLLFLLFQPPLFTTSLLACHKREEHSWQMRKVSHKYKYKQYLEKCLFNPNTTMMLGQTALSILKQRCLY